jgi:CRISPR/Cas system Type II protein with McrA/HNH and RuvC-like nuclease domain
MGAKEIYAQGGTRTCTQCGKTQPNDREHFGSRDGGMKVKNRCRQCENDNSKKSYRNDPSKMAARTERSKAIRGVLSWTDTPELRRLMGEQNNSCYYCGCRIFLSNATVDHKMPITRGGSDSIANLAACCATCNKNKGNKTEAEYLAFLDRVGKR